MEPGRVLLMPKGGKRAGSGRPRRYGSEEKATVRLGVRMTEQDLQRLQAFADRKGLTLSDAIRYLAEEFLTRLERTTKSEPTRAKPPKEKQ